MIKMLEKGTYKAGMGFYFMGEGIRRGGWQIPFPLLLFRVIFFASLVQWNPILVEAGRAELRDCPLRYSWVSKSWVCGFAVDSRLAS